MDDECLLEHISRDDQHAFQLLMERYYGALFVFATRQLRDNFIAEDVVQDTFLSIWNGRKKLTHVTMLKSYLYRIVRHKCVTVQRSSQRLQAFVHNHPDTVEDAMDQYIETETIRSFLAAIETLPPRSGLVIKLSLEGLRQEKIAEQMEITVATVKALKAEGIRRLRKSLRSFLFFYALAVRRPYRGSIA